MTFPGVGEEFPEREEDIIALVMRIIEAMERDPETFRDAPYSAADLRAALQEVRSATAAADAADRVQRQAFAEREQSLEALKGSLGRGVWSVEVNVRGTPEKLSGLGWGGSETTDRAPPGAVRDLAVHSMAGTSVVIDWRPPADGGPAAEYRVQRRMPGGAWEDLATAVDNECLLSDQPRGIEYDLRILAVNRSGASRPSDTVTVVL